MQYKWEHNYHLTAVAQNYVSAAAEFRMQNIHLQLNNQHRADV